VTITVVFAGRISLKVSPCARPNSSKSAREVGAGADDVREGAAGRDERLFDPLEAALGLLVGVEGRVAAVVHDRRAPGYEHAVPDPDGP
jgi:hypothetical protein